MKSYALFERLFEEAKPFLPGEHFYGYLVGFMFNPSTLHAYEPVVLFENGDEQQVWVVQSQDLVDELRDHLLNSPMGSHEGLYSKLWITWDPRTKQGSSKLP